MDKKDIVKAETYLFMRFQMWFYLIFSLLLISGITYIVMTMEQRALSLAYIFPFMTSTITMYYMTQLNMIKKYASSFETVEGLAVNIESSCHPRLFGIVLEYTNHSGEKMRTSSYHVFRAHEVKELMGHTYHIFISPESFHALMKDLTPLNQKEKSIVIQD